MNLDEVTNEKFALKTFIVGVVVVVVVWVIKTQAYLHQLTEVWFTSTMSFTFHHLIHNSSIVHQACEYYGLLTQIPPPPQRLHLIYVHRYNIIGYITTNNP